MSGAGAGIPGPVGWCALAQPGPPSPTHPPTHRSPHFRSAHAPAWTASRAWLRFLLAPTLLRRVLVVRVCAPWPPASLYESGAVVPAPVHDHGAGSGAPSGPPAPQSSAAKTLTSVMRVFKRGSVPSKPAGGTPGDNLAAVDPLAGGRRRTSVLGAADNSGGSDGASVCCARVHPPGYLCFPLFPAVFHQRTSCVQVRWCVGPCARAG